MEKYSLRIRFLEYLGIHKWIYQGSSYLPKPGEIRECAWCGKKEIHVEDGAASGMSDFEYWADIIDE